MSNQLPEFEPSIKQMIDFSSFICHVESLDAHKLGYVHVRPPQEWKQQLPTYTEDLMSSFSIQNPYSQEVSKQSSGLYTLHSEWLLDDKKRRKKIAYKEFRSLAISAEPTPDEVSDLPRAFWSDLTKDNVIYGPDCHNSLFRIEVSVWNLNFLGKKVCLSII